MNETIRKLKDVPYNLNDILEELRNGSGNASVSELNIFKQTVNSSELINNNGLFEITINHNMNSEITSILVKTINTRETVDFSCIEIDNNNAKIIISESIDIEVLLLGKNKVTETQTSESIQFSHEEFNATNVRDALVENKTSIQEINTNINNTQNDISTIQNELENLKQLANSGKSRIASAIGTPLLESDTFIQMEEKINTITSNFRTKLSDKGIEISDMDKISVLVEKIDEIENVNNLNIPPWLTFSKGDYWLNTKSLPTSRYNLTSSLVGDKIYCIGGTDNGVVSENECYDTMSNTWSTKASMITARNYLTSSAVGSKIYCLGGRNDGDIYILYKNECYDTITDIWTTKSSMLTDRYELTSSTVGSKIYCIGGYNHKHKYLKNECYDTMSNTWSTKANMIDGRDGLTSSAVGTNIYCFGGNTEDLHKNECYDTISDTWSTKTNMPTGRKGLTSSVVGSKIYCIGGNNNGVIIKNECYDTITDTWTTKANIPIDMNSAVLTSSVVDNIIYCFGGEFNYCYIV